MCRKSYTTLLLAALIMVPIVSVSAQDDVHALIASRAEAINDKVIEWRRDIHQHPELSNEEFRTGKKAADHLKALGFEVQTGVANTGVVGILRGDHPGKVVALRADMDGLPVEEQVDVPYASKERGMYRGKEVGIMHACGHDNHVAILMGAAEVLAGMKSQIHGTIVFIFQPAEEGTGGADVMVAEGVLKDPDVDAIFGLHVSQRLAVGEMGVRPGGTMAGSDSLEIVVHGRQTHAAMPWAGIDPIVMSAQVIMGLQTIVSRQANSTVAPAIFTIGIIEGGVRSNIIPDDVKMIGTIRTLDLEMQDDIHERVRATVKGIAESAGGSATVTIKKGAPVTYNDPMLTRSMRQSLEKIGGFENVSEPNPVTGAEDFAFYQKEVPGMFFFLGVRPTNVPMEEGIPNHSPFFYADEGALPLGVKTMAGLAIDFLNKERG